MESNKTIEEIITIIKEKLKINTHHLHGQAMHDHITIIGRRNLVFSCIANLKIM